MDPHIPALQDEDGQLVADKARKTRILAKKFFLDPPQVDLSDLISLGIPGEIVAPGSQANIRLEDRVTEKEVASVIKNLPKRKSPGLD
jgi:hypothetical protein